MERNYLIIEAQVKPFLKSHEHEEDKKDNQNQNHELDQRKETIRQKLALMNSIIKDLRATCTFYHRNMWILTRKTFAANEVSVRPMFSFLGAN